MSETKNGEKNPFAKLWINSGEVLTVISLIVLPIIVVLSHFLIVEYLLAPEKITYDLVKGTFVYKDSRQPIPNTVLLGRGLLNNFQYIVFVIILAIYPPYPAPISIRKYFKERGFKTAVDEYELVKKVLYVAVPLFITSIIIVGIHDLHFQYKIEKIRLLNGLVGTTIIRLPSNVPWPFNEGSELLHPHLDTFNYMKLLLFLIVTAAFLKILFAVRRKKFRLFYAKGSFRIMQDKQDEVEKMAYFVMGLNAYNLYLRRQIKLQINDLKRIYSQIASSSPKVKNEVIDKVSEVFREEKSEDNTLEPVRYLSTFMDIPETEILIEQPITNKLKQYGAAAAVVVPLAIQLFNALVLRQS